MEENKELLQQQDEVQKLAEVLPTAISIFSGLSRENRQKLIQSLATIFDLQGGSPAAASVAVPSVEFRSGHFSEDRSIPPKEFMRQKQPRTDVERVACLAYYLTHYRDQPEFKTLDISKLNTEAAQMKFSNAAVAVDNASKYGYLAPALRGSKQISAAGELFVRALPDRDAAKSAMAQARPRRRYKKGALRERDDNSAE